MKILKTTYSQRYKYFGVLSAVMPDLIRHPALICTWIPAFAGMT
jgi:uncharacterized membrane protein YraQ (UPF0718 family)